MTSEFTEDYFPSAITIVDDTPKDEIFLFVDQMPVFPGGEDALLRFLASTVRYPSDALHNNIDGRVFVQFVIDAKGKVTNVTIIRSVHPSLDREALRVVNSMPDWTPGMQNGRRVRVSYTVPIMFKLQTY
jgi:periplasmic protein TonB